MDPVLRPETTVSRHQFPLYKIYRQIYNITQSLFLSLLLEVLFKTVGVLRLMSTDNFFSKGIRGLKDVTVYFILDIGES